MSAITTGLPGASLGRGSSEKRKMMILAVVGVIFLVVLAFQLPRILNRGNSSGSASATAIAPSTPGPALAAPGSDSTTASNSPTSFARNAHALRKLPARDPFVPLIDATAGGSTSAADSAPGATPTTTPTLPVATVPAMSFAPSPAITPLPAPPKVRVVPLRPSAAVIWTNGRRQVVGLTQTFQVGDAAFRLVSVTRKTMRIRLVGGVFARGGTAITIRKGHGVTLANTATGVRYRLLFSVSTMEAPTVVPAADVPSTTTAVPTATTTSGLAAPAIPTTTTSSK